MITVDGKEFRNLQEQVEWNKEKIIEHYARDRVLADFGIRIIGAVSYTSEIPGYIDGTYNGQQFGDAYLISVSGSLAPPWDTYVWTRRNQDSAVQDGVWVDIGSLAIPGPQGIQGEQGIQGPPGPASQWYAGGDTLPAGDFTAGDMAILADGGVYRYDGREWRYVTNIRGPQGLRGLTGLQGEQGEQGIQGPPGPVGPPASAIRILGSLASVDYLPDPSTLSQADGVPAYLIVVGTETRLYYIQGAVGEESWGYIPFTGQGTIVTAEGTALSTWDTNTKLDKASGALRVYILDYNGQNSTITFDSEPYKYSMMYRDSNGRSKVASPESDEQITNKKYVDELAGNKPDKISTASRIYATDANGNQVALNYGYSAAVNIIVQRTANGNISVPEKPGNDISAASKKYVDDTVASATGSYVTAMITKIGETGRTCRLDISDLPDIVAGTQVTIFAAVDTSDIVTGPPPATLSIGNEIGRAHV